MCHSVTIRMDSLLPAFFDKQFSNFQWGIVHRTLFLRGCFDYILHWFYQAKSPASQHFTFEPKPSHGACAIEKFMSVRMCIDFLSWRCISHLGKVTTGTLLIIICHAL